MHMLRLCNNFRFYHPNNILWWVKIVEIITVQVFVSTSQFLIFDLASRVCVLCLLDVPIWQKIVYWVAASSLRTYVILKNIPVN
jgi:hypothetical protein